MAIMSLLKINGLLAIAILWAAFCMPISMISVRCSFLFNYWEIKYPPPIANNIISVMHRPNRPICAVIVS